MHKNTASQRSEPRTMIKVEDLIYEYPGKRVLNGVSFKLPEKSITALVGPNGAGKTTLLRCLTGLEEPFSGRVEIAGIDASENPRLIHRQIGYLSDFFGLYEDLTVTECLKHAALLQNIPTDKVQQRVDCVIELLELEPYAKNKAGVLSRGWRQRLGIAQALIHDPRLLILDEPASGLDPDARSSISKLFRTLNQQGITLIVSSHILAELEDYCTTMLILRDGKIIDEKSHASDSAKIVRIRFLDRAENHVDLIKNPSVLSPEFNEHELRFHFTGSDMDQKDLLKDLVAAGTPIVEFRVEQESLQDIYFSVNKRAPNHDQES